MNISKKIKPMIHLSLEHSIQVMAALDQKDFTEKPEEITNLEGDEIYMVWINKKSKTYTYIDLNFLMNNIDQTIQFTQLKDIKQWQK